MRKTKGFTLIELLVVISIIALLMSMLMPALQRVRKQAQKLVCLSNLRQWGVIMYIYLEDHKGKLPEAVGGGDNWLGVTTPYIEDDKLRLCPSADKTLLEGARQPFVANDTQRDGYKGSYGFHDWFTNRVQEGEDEWNSHLWKHAEQKNAEKIPILAGAVRLYLMNPLHSDEPPEYEADVVFGSGMAQGEFKNYCVNRHMGYNNGLFLDFSARSIGLKELWELEWHPNWNPNNDPPPDWPEWMQGFKDYR